MAARAWTRVVAGARWRLGLRVASAELEGGDDASIARFYSARVTDCSFLEDPTHYEFPRSRWILDRVRGGRLLEIGCGNGGMTRLLAPQVDRVVAMDVSRPSLEALRARGLANVETKESLIERFTPAGAFDWIVMSEVIEHLRAPSEAVARAVSWLAPGGKLVLSTPNGHWHSDEHLHEFSLASFAGLLARSGLESFEVGYVRDGAGKRRWLVGCGATPLAPAASDAFAPRGEGVKEIAAAVKRALGRPGV